MSTVEIYNIDNNTLMKKDIMYNGLILEATIPYNIAKFNAIANVKEEDIPECLSIIFEDNQDSLYVKILYSKENELLIILASTQLKTNNWVSLNKVKSLKSSIVDDLLKIVHSTIDSGISLQEIIEKNNNQIDPSKTIQKLEESINKVYPNTSIELLDYDQEYKDLFISVKVNNQVYDFNIWPFDGELEIEDYTMDETSLSIKEIIESNTSIIFDLYNNTKERYNYKLKIKDTNLILWITNDTITLTNNYENDYERILILEISDYKKYSSDYLISEIVKTCENDLLNKIRIPKEEIRKLII